MKESLGVVQILPKNNQFGSFNSRMIMLDAQPYVMMFARRVFEKAIHRVHSGKYTHKVVLVPLHSSSAKDFHWFTSRFPLDFDGDSFEVIHQKAVEYDKSLEITQEAWKDSVSRVSAQALPFGVTPRDHQFQFLNAFNTNRRMLLADVLGLGKTYSGLMTLAEPSARPALIVCPTHLCTQWRMETEKFYPGSTSHIIPGFKNYELPKVDFLITSYNRLSHWIDPLSAYGIAGMVFDEVHELRKTGTAKREAARHLSERALQVAGMSGTPIFNYGIETWSVGDAIRPDAFGSESEFASEWCDYDRKVREPAVLQNYLKQQGFFMRRTPQDTGMNFGKTNKQIITIDSDLRALKDLENVAKKLALSIVSNIVGTSSDAARDFDWKLRQATGVAKAKSVAEFTKMICEQGEKVIVTVWHREVYDILMKELSAFHPVMYSGTETTKEKAKSIQTFKEDDKCKVFLLSMRSGAGIDGLQHVCSNIVHAELDWSPHVMDQCNGRVDRDGQSRMVNAYYLTINDGSDPFIMSILNVKRSQHEGIIEGKESTPEVLNAQADAGRVREMAKAYLTSIGEEVKEPFQETGLLKETADFLRRIKVPNSTEDELQIALWNAFKQFPHKVEREVKIGKKSRVDFLVSNGVEKIAIECKIEHTERSSVYKQVKRYVEEIGVTSAIVFAPWFGIPSFVIESTPVVVVDYTIHSI